MNILPDNHHYKNAGFTLVELAIVLMIIGLLIGGVLRGQELMNNARRSALIQQVKAYQGAIVSFQDTYSQFPGDMANAQARVPGCTAANFCLNGDGNGLIGLTIPNAVATAQNGTTVPQVETTMFWKHLALAHLISGIMPNANPANPDTGETHPAAKIGNASFVVATKTTGEPDYFASGPLLRLQQAPNNRSGALSLIDARTIDEKMDDGRPNAGFVGAESVSSECKTNDGATGEYTANMDDRPRCILYFKI